MLVCFSVFPVGEGESLSEHVAEIIKLIVESGLSYKVGAMATSVEGEWDEIMDLIKKCRDKMLEVSNRVYLVITIDDRKNATDRLTGKVKSIEKRLGRSLS